MSDDDPKPATINISAPGYLFPTMFLWAVAAPCTMAVCRYTIAPELTWWDVTMPLWGVPAVLVGLVLSVVGLAVGALLAMVAVLVVIAPPIYTYAWVRDRCLTVWRWSENWRYTRNEARMALNHVKISEGITNRIKQEFASLGASDVSLKCENIDLGVKVRISLPVNDKSEVVGGCSWSLMDAEGKPPKFFSNDLTTTIQSVRKSMKEERSKSCPTPKD